ncbi:MAG: winged helix-turn-helix domain-containing protein [Oceanicaulis sp.]|nr:winged helix-turn-helix domain-containing protein [Oceanicaulis sp.]
MEPQVMDLLVYLAEANGEVRSKDEIASALWPDASVNDDALSRTVWKLRQALGDDAKSPRYVQTVSRRGYRLLETIQPVNDTPQTPLGKVGAPVMAASAAVLMIILVGRACCREAGRRRTLSLRSRQTMRPRRCLIARTAFTPNIRARTMKRPCGFMSGCWRKIRAMRRRWRDRRTP